MIHYQNDVGICTFMACCFAVLAPIVSAINLAAGGMVYLARGSCPQLVEGFWFTVHLAPFWFVGSCFAGFGMFLLFKGRMIGELFGLLALFIGGLGVVFAMAL